MAHNTTYQFRLDETIKRESFKVFRELGMTPGDGIRIFLTTVARTKNIPFLIEYPPNEQQEKRNKAVASYEDYLKKVAQKASPATENLTDEDINQLVHELR